MYSRRIVRYRQSGKGSAPILRILLSHLTITSAAQWQVALGSCNSGQRLRLR